MSWVRQPAETELVYELGNEYPVAVICTIFEENQQGERRLVDHRTLTVVGSPSTPIIKATKDTEYMHGVDCDKKGEINVYHFSDCEGGEACSLFKYLSQDGVPEKHLSKGYEYWVKRNAKGEFEFTDKRKLVAK